MEIDIEKIEETIGYTFYNKDLLIRALTRKAHANEKRQKKQKCEDQEIFRTLGDAVLKTVLVDLLIESGWWTCAQITQKKEKLESKRALAEISRKFDMASYIATGKGEEKQKANEQPRVLAETLEAVIGAIYIDGRYEAAHKTISKWFKERLPTKT